MSKIVSVVLCFLSAYSFAEINRYSEVSNKFGKYALNENAVENAKMQGECLVQLKELTFKKKNTFDPISEWINYRSVSLLEQYSPCEVLIMLEVANNKIRSGEQKDQTQKSGSK